AGTVLVKVIGPGNGALAGSGGPSGASVEATAPRRQPQPAPTIDPPATYPTSLMDVDGTLFFVMRDLAHGQGSMLGKSDGTEAGTVMVREFGSISSDV